MKYLLASLSITLAASSLAAAAPTAPEPAEAVESSQAPSVQNLELARRFIALSNPADEMMDSIRDTALAAFSVTTGEAGDEAARKAGERRVDAILSRAEPTFRQRMPEILEAYSQVYAREFSAEELQQLITFAQTPSGKHYIAREGILDLDPAIIEANEALTDELTPIMLEVTKELCAEKAAQRLAAGDKNAKCPLSGEPDTRSL